jgi:hypothetical protein
VNKDDIEAVERKILNAIPFRMGVPADPKTQYEVIHNPPVLETMTYLKPSQVVFVSLANWSAKDETPFSCLKDWARELMLSMKSEKGRGIDAVINLVKAQHAPSGSNVNVFSQLKDKAVKAKEKVTGSEE